MPTTVDTRLGAIEFPDSMTHAEIESALHELVPPTGQEVADRLSQDPDFKPSEDEYKLFEDYSKTKHTDWLDTVARGVGAAGSILASGAKEMGGLAQWNPANSIEAFAQGTRSLYGLLTESAEPSSPLFRFKNYVFGDGSLKSRYDQFLEARDFARRSGRLERGEETLAMDKEAVNPEFVQAAALIADPTLFLPGLGEAAGLGKLASKAVGLGAETAGKAVNVLAKPAEAALEKASVAAEKAGFSPATVAGAAAVAGHPGVAAALVAPKIVEGVRAGADVLETAGQNLAGGASRLGPMEAVGQVSDASKLQRAIGTVGRMGGDAALDTGLRSAAGALEGATIGAALGFWQGGEEGAASGIGFGAPLGAVGAGTARAAEKLSGRAAKEARLADLNRFVDALGPDDKAKIQRVIRRDGETAAIQLLDGAKLISGKLQDINVRFLSDAEFLAQHGADARGVEYHEGDAQPTIDINVDKPDAHKTLAHEMFHAMQRVEQLAPEIQGLQRHLLGLFDREGNQIEPGVFTEGQVDSLFKKYSKKPEGWETMTSAQKADFIFGEIGGEYLGQLLSGSDPDALLRGFDGLTRQLVDRAVTKYADSLLGRIAARIGNPKLDDSIVFGKALPEASPVVRSMMRDLVRARRKLNERIELQEAKDIVLKRSEAIPAAVGQELADSPVNPVKRNVDGTFTLRSDADMAIEEKKFNNSLAQVLASSRPADGSAHVRQVDGQLTGEKLAPEQMKAVEASPLLNNKVKEVLAVIGQGLADGNVLQLTYGPASSKDRKGRTRYSTLKVGDRQIVPYQLKQNEHGDFYVQGLRISAVRERAQKLAQRGNLGPYGSSFQGFLSDFLSYLGNLTHGSEHTADFFKARGDSAADAQAKAGYLHDFLGSREKGKAFVASYRLDRVVSARALADRVPFRELAWDKMKVRWMPETIGGKEILSSKEGYRIIRGERGWKLYQPDGTLRGIFKHQAIAELRAEALAQRQTPPPGPTTQ